MIDLPQIRDNNGNIEGTDVVQSAAHAVLEKMSGCDEPLAIVDLARARQKLDEWHQFLPRVAPHYAVKCNPDEMLLRELQSAGCRFDCATEAEIREVLSIGASPDNIVFSHPCKRRTDLEYAKAENVRLMSFDNATELKKVAEVFPGARLLLRLVCEDTSAQCPMSSKFGVAPIQWEPLLAEAAHLSLHVVGVSFHVGSGCRDPDSFQQALSDAKEVFALAMAKGFVMEVLDIGGGWPGVDSDDVCFAPLATNVAKKLDDNFPADAFPTLRIIAEPGRFFACSAVSLLTKVIAKAKPSVDESDGVEEKFRYYLNDGVYGSFNCIIYDHAEVEPEVLKGLAGMAKLCWIFGPTCDGFDVILKDYMIPELHEGDWLLWRNMGAYTSAAGSNFNGFPSVRSLYFYGECPLPSLARTPERTKDSLTRCALAADGSTPSLNAQETNRHIPNDAGSLSSAQGAQSSLNAATDLGLERASRAHRLEGEMSLGGGSPFGEGSPRRLLPNTPQLVLLVLSSLCWALHNIGFSWAAHRHTFSPVAPAIVQSLGLALCILIALLYKYGTAELAGVYNRRYLWFAISGSIEGLMFCLMNFALTRASATRVSVLMQVQVLVIMVLQASFLRSFPSSVQMVCVASAMCMLLSYNVAVAHDNRNGSGEAGGVMLACGAALCSGACDIALEYFSKKSASVATNQNADLMRCMFFHEAFKIPIACVLLFFFDAEFGNAGFFGGWDYTVVIGGTVSPAVALAFFNTAVVLYGALEANLVLGIEVVFVYLGDVLVLQSSTFDAVQLLQMCCFAGLIVAYNLDVLNTVSWKAALADASSSARLLP